MIELRWENRLVPSYDGKWLGKVRVLQTRTKNVHIDSSTTIPVDPAWSEWQDVPEVFEDK